ncbi:MAG TPA: M48 family metalloprotease [Flavobacterium sp.]|nr:M48 family metalloprotease [Flavobacterium sp.]
MKNIIFKLLLATVMAVAGANSQVLSDKAIGAVGKGIKGFTFSDAEAAKLSKEAVGEMDKINPVAGPKDGYAMRLERLFGKHKSENGLALNYKVYKVKDVNAFATADGSVRVFQGLMDIMDDNQLLAVIGHEIGHVANHDSRDAIKAAYKKEALLDAVASQSDKIAALTDTQLAKLGNAMIDSRHSRKQETEADDYSYEFMKRNGYDVNAVESAFAILAKMGEGAESSFLSRMVSSHPDPKQRAAKARARAEKDKLYKAYVQKPFSNASKTAKPKKKKK